METERQQPQQTLKSIGQDILADWQARYGRLSAALPRPEAALAGMMPAYRAAMGDLHRIQTGWMDGIAAVSALCDPQLPWHWLDGGGIGVQEAGTVGIPENQGKRSSGPEPLLARHSPTPPSPHLPPAGIPSHRAVPEWPARAYPLGADAPAREGQGKGQINHETQDGFSGTQLKSDTPKALHQLPDKELFQPEISPQWLNGQVPNSWPFNALETAGQDQHGSPQLGGGSALPTDDEDIHGHHLARKTRAVPPHNEVQPPQNISFRGLADFAASAQQLTAGTGSHPAREYPADTEASAQTLPPPQHPATMPVHKAAMPPLSRQPADGEGYIHPSTSFSRMAMTPPSAALYPTVAQESAQPDWDELQRIVDVGAPASRLTSLRPTHIAAPQMAHSPLVPHMEASQQTASTATTQHIVHREEPDTAPPFPQTMETLSSRPTMPLVAKATPLPLHQDPVPVPEFLVEDLLDQLALQLQRDFQRIYGR